MGVYFCCLLFQLLLKLGDRTSIEKLTYFSLCVCVCMYVCVYMCRNILEARMKVLFQWVFAFATQLRALQVQVQNHLRYLCVYLAALGLSHGTWDLRCIMWDHSLHHTDSLLVAYGLSSVVCGLSCLMVCGIVDPQSGIKPTSSALKGGFSTTGPPGKSQNHFKPNTCFEHFIRPTSGTMNLGNKLEWGMACGYNF